MASKLRPFRDYSEHDVINLFAHIDSAVDAGTVVKLNANANWATSGWHNQDDGDGLSNINLTKLIKFHKRCRGLVTMTAVRPPARFGAIKIKGNKVFYFKEKSKMDEGWINGGFFVIETKFLKYISSDKTFLEREPLEKITKFRKLNAFKHKGYWHTCRKTKGLQSKELSKQLKNK